MSEGTDAALAAGFEPARLTRVDRHLARYVDDSRLAGWELAPQVFVKGTHLSPFTVPAQEPIRVWHLLAHASGLSAGFMYTNAVDQLYRSAGYEWGAPPGSSLEDCVRDWAALPLRFEPGSAWGYGVSTDVLGRLLEVITGAPLDEVFRARVTGPLGMEDTDFHAAGDRASRLPAVYQPPHPRGGPAIRNDPASLAGANKPTVLSGGGGLVSTVVDYTRFTRMLAGQGEFEGVRVLAPSTVHLMRQNHLPGDLAQCSTGGFAETTFDGVGFGLGFATILDPVKLRTPSSVGEFYWGGAYSTAFWVDPVRDVTCIFMTQLFPSSTYPIRAQLRQLVYSALTG